MSIRGRCPKKVARGMRRSDFCEPMIGMPWATGARTPGFPGRQRSVWTRAIAGALLRANGAPGERDSVSCRGGSTRSSRRPGPRSAPLRRGQGAPVCDAGQDERDVRARPPRPGAMGSEAPGGRASCARRRPAAAGARNRALGPASALRRGCSACRRTRERSLYRRTNSVAIPIPSRDRGPFIDSLEAEWKQERAAVFAICPRNETGLVGVIGLHVSPMDRGVAETGSVWLSTGEATPPKPRGASASRASRTGASGAFKPPHTEATARPSEC
jgi:hypothetical protein